MARQSKSINFSDLFKDVNEEFSVILKKCNNGSALDLLGADELNILKNFILNLIRENDLEEIPEINIPILKNCLELLLCISNSNVKAEMKLEFINIIEYINTSELLNSETGIKNIISKINEYWMIKIPMADEIKGMEYFTLKHLLELCTSERPLVSDLQRLSSIRKSITEVPFDKSVPSLRPLLIKLVQKMDVLSSEHIQRFIAQALVLSHKNMMEIHKTIMLELNTCNKKKAGDYGKIYVMAWHVAVEDMKKMLEKNCFQHLMETMMKEHRTSLELKKSSQNILAVLEVWHSERKKKNPDFITMLTNAYQPILWKYLQSGFNVHRCNATDVFFKAFPLQRAGDNAVEAETLFNRQFDAMLSSLTDDCHIVRIIGIREVCNILSLYWNSFTPIQIQSLMSVLTKQNTTDVSTAEVRRMVYIGFQSLVKSPLSREYVKQILPNLADNIHDINQKVRIAFIQLLICIKDLKDPNFKYNDIVPMVSIQCRLAEDSIVVGHWIVKLLIKNYYHSKMSVVEWTKRFIYLIKTYKHSYRNFFFYSSKSLPFDDACNIICEILTQLGTFVLGKFKNDQENNGNEAENSRVKKGNKNKLPLTNWNGNQCSQETGNDSGKKCAFDDQEVVAGLFDIVTILWVLHDAKLTKPENEEKRFKLYDTYVKYAQPFISYYKDSDLFLGIITLSGNIPASLLRNNSITLPGYCIKMIKSIEVNRSDEENEKIVSMLIALVKWGRGGEILEQIALWLDAAFETKDMNETILPRRRVKINDGIQPNSIVAIYILDTLLKKEYVKLSILKKNYNELFSLWKFMSRIRKLIETRIDQGEPFEEELVSDEFLILCFRRYLKLIPLLKEDGNEENEKENRSHNSSETSEVFVNRQKEMENVIEWGENFLFPLLQGEYLEESDADLITSSLEDILFVADNMILVHIVNNSFHFKIAHLALKLLSTRYGINFIKAASRVTLAINFSAKLLFRVKDDLQIFSTVIPSLLSHTLDVLTSQKLSPKQIKKLEEDMPTIKNCFGKILATYHDNLSSTTNLKENARLLKLVVSFFVDSLIYLVCQEMSEDSSLPVYSAVSQLPPVAGLLVSLFHNKKTWTPLFLHVISSKLSATTYCFKTAASCVVLLNLFAVSDKKSNSNDIKKALGFAKENLTKSRERLKRKKQQDDLVAEEETNVRKSLHSSAATRGCSVSLNEVNQKTVVEEDVSKEVSMDVEETNEIQSNDENSMSTSSFQNDKNNTEVDFITAGLDLINNIENIINKRSLENEENLC